MTHTAAIDETAALWVTREDEGRLGPEGRAALEAWLAEDAAHARAYAAARAACEAAARHAADPEMMALRAAALAAAPQSRPAWRIAAAVAVGAVLLGGTWSTVTAINAPAASPIGAVAARLAPSLPATAALYHTDVGERSTVVLPDGSVATLNTDTLVKVAYRDGERGVRLLRGQALFEVAKNKRVPFRVYAGDRRVTAVGTVFDVRLQGKAVNVTLVEGVVKVAAVRPSSPTPTQQVTMTAGEVLEAPKPAAPMVVKVADVRRAVSWREGVVVFDDAPLAQAVAEMNRYSTHPVTLGDPSLGALRVSGVFKTGDPDRFAAQMAEVFPVEVTEGPRGGPQLRPAPGG